MGNMIVSKGVRYTEEDAKRLGIKADDTTEGAESNVKVYKAVKVEDSQLLSNATVPPSGAENQNQAPPEESRGTDPAEEPDEEQRKAAAGVSPEDQAKADAKQEEEAEQTRKARRSSENKARGGSENK